MPIALSSAESIEEKTKPRFGSQGSIDERVRELSGRCTEDERHLSFREECEKDSIPAGYGVKRDGGKNLSFIHLDPD